MVMELPVADDSVADGITAFIRQSVSDAGCTDAVIGLSGGLDSAVVTKLTADALGPDHVLNVFMPSGTTSDDDRRITSELCRKWGTEYKVVEIGNIVDTMIREIGDSDDSDLDRGNIAARCRMSILYNQAKKRNALVIGTSNLSERMMGYFTKHGDGACDIAPIANLYKTQVRQVAKIIGVPEEVISKPPSAGLWEGQTDEGEMGMEYAELDMILCAIDAGFDDEAVCYMTSSPLDKVQKVRAAVKNTSHKRGLPPTLTFNTVIE